MGATMRDKFDRLRLDSARMAGQVQRMVSDTASALLRGDIGLARKVVENDDAVDAAEMRIERDAIDLLSLYRPVAGEFRAALMTLRVNTELERIGDCAGNVASQVVPMTCEATRCDASYKLPPALADLAAAVEDLMTRTVQAHNFADVNLAAAVISGDERLDALYAQVLQEAESDLSGQAERRDRHLPIIMCAKNLERIGDHCTNVAETVLYVARGELVRHRNAI